LGIARVVLAPPVGKERIERVGGVGRLEADQNLADLPFGRRPVQSRTAGLTTAGLPVAVGPLGDFLPEGGAVGKHGRGGLVVRAQQGHCGSLRVEALALADADTRAAESAR